MAKVISLSKEEKLAILRVIIELNNTYDIRFSDDVFKFIQRVSIELTTPNSLYLATNISFLEAKNILTKSFENDSAKKKLFEDILAIMLSTAVDLYNAPILEEVSNLNKKHTNQWESLWDLSEKNDDWDNYDNLNAELERKHGEEICQLTEKFTQEWKLIPEIIGANINQFIGLLEECDINEFENIIDKTEWILIDEHNDSLIVDPDKDKLHNELNNQLYSELKDKLYKELEDFLTTNLDTIHNDLQETICNELKENLSKDIKEFVRKEIKELVSKEVNETLHKHLKDFATNNFNETLYKDL